MYCLWFGTQKIYDLEQLKKYFDFDAVEMYFLGGGLSRWLRQCGENDLAEQIDGIDLLGDISVQLAEVFNVPLPSGRSNAPCDKLSNQSSDCGGSFGAASFQNGSFASELLNPLPNNGSFDMGSFELGSFEIGSFEIGSFNSGSFEIGSFNSVAVGSFASAASGVLSGSFQNLYGSFETASFSLENLFSKGSFSNIYTSFLTTSFGLHQYEYEFSTSFLSMATSFNITSFNITQYAGSFNSGSFNMGSFGTAIPEVLPMQTEKTPVYTKELTAEEKIIMNISSCSLNRFGYGLHLI